MILPPWALLALGAALMWGCINIFDKIIISNYLSWKQMFMFAPAKIIFFLPLLFFFDIHISLSTAIVSVLIGLLNFVSIVFYFFGLRDGEVSRLAPLFCFTPLAVAILSALFLSEIFSMPSYGGIALLLIGASLLSYEKSGERRFNKRVIGFFALSVILFAVYDVLIKYTLRSADPFSVFFFASIGSFFLVSPFFWATENRSEFFSKIKSWKVLSLCFFDGLLVIIAYIFHFFAISSGYVTLVSSLEETQAFFVVIIATILSYLNRDLIKEKFSSFGLVQKIVAVSLMFAGVLLVTT